MIVKRQSKCWLMEAAASYIEIEPQCAEFFGQRATKCVTRICVDQNREELLGKMVPRGRIELPTPRFSVVCSTD